MRLKEILMERKRASVVSVQTEPQLPTADNQVAERPQIIFATPTSEFDALFADCEDF